MNGNWAALVMTAGFCLGLAIVLTLVAMAAAYRKHRSSEWLATAALMLGLPLLAFPLLVALLWFKVIDAPLLTGEQQVKQVEYLAPSAFPRIPDEAQSAPAALPQPDQAP